MCCHSEFGHSLGCHTLVNDSRRVQRQEFAMILAIFYHCFSTVLYKLVDLVLKLVDLDLKLMDLVLKLVDLDLKLVDLVLKLVDLSGS